MKLLSYIVNGILISFLFWYFLVHIGIAVYYHEYISPREEFLEDIYYRAKVDLFEKINSSLSKKEKFIVFLGDSILDQFPVYEFYQYGNVINRSIGSDTTRGVLARIENNVNNLNIERCFVMVGHNDFKYRDEQEIFLNIKNIFTKIHADKKYFISILPSDDTEKQLVEVLNRKIKSFCEANNITYIDCYSGFITSDGLLDTDLFYDGVHPNFTGFVELRKSIAPFLSAGAGIL